MSDNKATSGQWGIGEPHKHDNTDFFQVDVATRDEIVARACGWTPEEALANARLMVAAPDMATALRSAVKTAGGMYLIPAGAYLTAMASLEGA